MSIYDNETSEIYPDLNPTALLQESQAYRLRKLTEIEAYLFDEIEVRRRQVKKKKRINMATSIKDAGLITSPVITQVISIPAFSSGVGLPVGAALGGLGIVLPLLTISRRKISRSQTVKQGKHDAIMLLAQSKLDGITNIISQAMQDRDISPAEFHKVVQEVEKYCKLKADIRNRTKAKVKQIEKEQRDELLEQGRKEERKEGKENFLQQIANTSGTQGVSVI